MSGIQRVASVARAARLAFPITTEAGDAITTEAGDALLGEAGGPLTEYVFGGSPLAIDDEFRAAVGLSLNEDVVRLEVRRSARMVTQPPSLIEYPEGSSEFYSVLRKAPIGPRRPGKLELLARRLK